jgi:hypothetical protein
VHKEERLKKPKLPDSKVRRHDSLLALDAANADANMGLLEHLDVIGAIANCEGDKAAITTEAHDLSLFARGDAAADDRVAPACNAPKGLGVFRGREGKAKGATRNNKGLITAPDRTDATPGGIIGLRRNGCCG